MKKIDKYLFLSFLLLLSIATFLFFAVKFLYSTTRYALEADQEKVKSRVIQFDMQDYQKLDPRFKIY